MATEGVSTDVLRTCDAGKAHERAEARRVEHAGHPDYALMRKSGARGKQVSHLLKRVGNHDDDGLWRVGADGVGHPAHDLLRWPDPVDREAVLRGYREAGDPGTGFWAYWPVAVMVVDLILMLRRPEARDAARERVISTVGEWGRG